MEPLLSSTTSSRRGASLLGAQTNPNHASSASINASSDYQSVTDYHHHHDDAIHSMDSRVSNGGVGITDDPHDSGDDNEMDDQKLDDESSTTGNDEIEFDDLEFLHDILAHEATKSWFSANCFECNLKNTCILSVLLVLLGVLLYILFHFYGQSYIVPNHKELLKLASIPLICIAFTYGHIALALWMTFWPTEFFPHPALQFKSGPFKGYGLGWQGIVPMKSIKMAQIAVDLMVPDVVRMEDVVAKIDAARVTEIIRPALMEILKILIPRVAAKQTPIGWALLPEPIKASLIEVAMADSHASVSAMIADINANIEQLFDLTQFVSDALRSDKELLSNVFLECGAKELIFIRNFGALMGLTFGVLQMVANLYLASNFWFRHLMLPVSGFLLGWLTNWIALTLIFRPIEPWVLCRRPRITLQGLFLRRQREVSVAFAAFITHKILRAENILMAMYSGPSSDRLFMKMSQHLQEGCDRFGGYRSVKPIVEWSLGSDKFRAAKQEIVQGMFECMHLQCVDEIVRVQKELERYTDEAMDIERLLRTKMAALSPQQFEGVLHPVFEQDEIKLIVIGAMLGLLVGLFQVYVIGN